MQPLIPFGELLGSGWNRFVSDWRHNLELSIRFLLGSVIIFAAAFFGQSLPVNGQLVLTIAAIIAASVINLHTVITLADRVLRREQTGAETPISVEAGWKHFWPFALIAFLQTLAVIGGLAVFVLPGIWLSVALGYALFVYLDRGTRGVEALAASYELVKGRWWAVFGRSLASGVVVGILSAASTLLVLLIVSLFIGFDKIFGFADAVSTLESADPLADGIQAVLSGIIRAIFVPLGIIYQAKIYLALKKSR